MLRREKARVVEGIRVAEVTGRADFGCDFDLLPVVERYFGIAGLEIDGQPGGCMRA